MRGRVLELALAAFVAVIAFTTHIAGAF